MTVSPWLQWEDIGLSLLAYLYTSLKAGLARHVMRWVFNSLYKSKSQKKMPLSIDWIMNNLICTCIDYGDPITVHVAHRHIQNYIKFTPNMEPAEPACKLYITSPRYGHSWYVSKGNTHYKPLLISNSLAQFSTWTCRVHKKTAKGAERRGCYTPG